MPAATLSVARACVSAKTPVRLLHRRLAPSPGRIVVRISCEPEGARKPSEPVEDWSVSEDESGSDFEGEKGGRNVVKDLAQDNSFIGVLVVALGAGLVASANSLLSAFGVEPPRLRRRRIKGMSLPARRQSTNVIRLSDRPIPKLEVPSGNHTPHHQCMCTLHMSPKLPEQCSSTSHLCFHYFSCYMQNQIALDQQQ